MPLRRRPPPAHLWKFIHNSNGKHWSAVGENIQKAIDDIDSEGTVWLPCGILDLGDDTLTVKERGNLTIKGVGIPPTKDGIDVTNVDKGTIIKTTSRGPVIELEYTAGAKAGTILNLYNLALRVDNPKYERGIKLTGLMSGIFENIDIHHTQLTLPDPSPPYSGSIGWLADTPAGQHMVNLRNVRIWNFYRGFDIKQDHHHLDNCLVMYSNNVAFRIESSLQTLLSNCHAYRCGATYYAHGGSKTGGMQATFINCMSEPSGLGIPPGFSSPVTAYSVFYNYPPTLIINPLFLGTIDEKYAGTLTRTTIIENMHDALPKIGLARTDFGTDDQLQLNAYMTVGDVSALPTPSETYRGRIICVLGGAGVADTYYICLKSAADTYSWVAIATG